MKYRLTLSWRMPFSYRNQSIDLLRISMDWFLYDNDLCHERVKNLLSCKSCIIEFIQFISHWIYRKSYYQIKYRTKHRIVTAFSKIISLIFVWIFLFFPWPKNLSIIYFLPDLKLKNIGFPYTSLTLNVPIPDKVKKLS